MEMKPDPNWFEKRQKEKEELESLTTEELKEKVDEYVETNLEMYREFVQENKEAMFNHHGTDHWEHDFFKEKMEENFEKQQEWEEKKEKWQEMREETSRKDMLLLLHESRGDLWAMFRDL